MTAFVSPTARWSRGGYVEARPWLSSYCKYCGRVQQEGDCRLVDCLACGSRQCHGNGGGRGTCAICHHGWLPSWSHGYSDDRLCGYKGCGRDAVAYAPRVRRVCKEHLTRVTVGTGKTRQTLGIYIAERVAERDSGKGRYPMSGWRWVE